MLCCVLSRVLSSLSSAWDGGGIGVADWDCDCDWRWESSFRRGVDNRSRDFDDKIDGESSSSSSLLKFPEIKFSKTFLSSWLVLVGWSIMLSILLLK